MKRNFRSRNSHLLTDSDTDIFENLGKNLDAPLPEDLNIKETTPSWLVDIIQKDRDISSALFRKNAKLSSPHKQRLLQAAKAPQIVTSATAEHWVQVRIFYWLEMNHPDLYPYVKAVPNGGSRPRATAAHMKYEGQKPGALDIDVDFPRGAYHGMKLEVKTDIGTAQKNQRESVERLSSVGYYCTIEKGYEACIQALSNYFTLPVFDNQTVLLQE